LSVDSKKDLTHLINYLETYPLLTQGRRHAADLLLFKQVVQLTINKEHLNQEGLTQIVNIKSSMNLGGRSLA
jgi:hypothetical protein